jgi:ankyrin repeat protein
VDATGKTAIVYAAAKGFPDVVDLLLESGVEVDARYGNGLTALMWAAGHSNEVPVGEGVETVELLLARGAGVDLADDRGRTALMIAAERGHAEIVASLLATGDLASEAAVRKALGGG